MNDISDEAYASEEEPKKKAKVRIEGKEWRDQSKLMSLQKSPRRKSKKEISDEDDD